MNVLKLKRTLNAELARYMPNCWPALERCIVLEVFPEKGGSYGDAFYPPEFVNFDAILLTDLGERTQVSFFGIEVYAEHDDAYDKDIHDQIHRYFENLRELCEAS